MDLFHLGKRLAEALERHSVALQTNTMGLLQMSQASDRLASSIEALASAATSRTTELSAEVATLNQRVTELEAQPTTGVDEATLNAMADRVDQLAAGFAPTMVP